MLHNIILQISHHIIHVVRTHEKLQCMIFWTACDN